MVRLAVSIAFGIIFSFFSVSLFDQWETFYLALEFSTTNFFKAGSTLIGANFNFDIISFFIGGPLRIDAFFTPAFLGCIFSGFICGVIAKGTKRGLASGLIVIIIDLLVWILLSIISGQDLMALFQDVQLITTLGGILSGILGASVGSLVGGSISGPYEEIF